MAVSSGAHFASSRRHWSSTLVGATTSTGPSSPRALRMRSAAMACTVFPRPMSSARRRRSMSRRTRTPSRWKGISGAGHDSGPASASSAGTSGGRVPGHRMSLRRLARSAESRVDADVSRRDSVRVAAKPVSRVTAATRGSSSAASAAVATRASMSSPGRPTSTARSTRSAAAVGRLTHDPSPPACAPATWNTGTPRLAAVDRSSSPGAAITSAGPVVLDPSNAPAAAPPASPSTPPGAKATANRTG